MQRIHAFIYGEVHGVFFRANTRSIANKLNIKGWVKNLPDGRVEVLAEGSKENIKEFIKFLNKGPRHSVVKKVEIKKEDHKGEFTDFRISF